MRYQRNRKGPRSWNAAIEQEIERQRGLENQIAGVNCGSRSARNRRAYATAQVKSAGTGRVESVLPHNEKTIQLLVSRLTTPAPRRSPPPFNNVEVRDINGDGVPGSMDLSQSAEAGGNYASGRSYQERRQSRYLELLQRWPTGATRGDTKGQGSPDTFFYYDNDKIAREERDETGEGRMTYRASLSKWPPCESRKRFQRQRTDGPLGVTMIRQETARSSSKKNAT